MPETKDIPAPERRPFSVYLDDDIKAELKERAKRNHRSVTGEIRAILDEAVRDADA